MAVSFNYFLSIHGDIFNIDISPGRPSIATCLRCGEIFKYEVYYKFTAESHI